MTRQLKYFEAIREATDQAMQRDSTVFLLGLGVPDPKGIFGTTLGLQKKYGVDRVQDMPLSENAMTGVALGSALAGLRPVISHQRVDFALVAMEQMVNQAAKWHYMFGGQTKIPLVVRMIIGRGWGQGPQHSQSLQAWFAHVPGLKVVMPTTAHDAKGLLAASIEDDNPVIFLEHRWLHGISGYVPEDPYTVPLGKARIMRAGGDVTIVSASYMSIEAIRAAGYLEKEGISAEVVDLRSIHPWDIDCVLASVRKTGRLIVADTGGKSFGISAEIVATVLEREFSSLKCAPVRIALPDHPCPTSPALSDHYYPTSGHIIQAVAEMFGIEKKAVFFHLAQGARRDVPDASFTGPF
jgi:pyruvate dehydrogenase E1 component beta subunit